MAIVAVLSLWPEPVAGRDGAAAGTVVVGVTGPEPASVVVGASVVAGAVVVVAAIVVVVVVVVVVVDDVVVSCWGTTTVKVAQPNWGSHCAPCCGRTLAKPCGRENSGAAVPM